MKFLLVCFFMLFSTRLLASEESRWGGFAGAGTSFSSLGSNDADLKNRWMLNTNAFGFYGIKYRQFTFGLFANVLHQEQMTKLAQAGNTNLKGRGYLFGPSLRYIYDQKYFAFLALELAGKYDLIQNTEDDQDDHFQAPLGIRLKLGQFINTRYPITFDIDLAYRRYQEMVVGDKKLDWTANETSLGFSLSYHFGGTLPYYSKYTESEKTSAYPQSVIRVEDIEWEEGANVFQPYHSALTPQMESSIAKVILNFDLKMIEYLMVEGHSDNSGSSNENDALSLARAESVKTYLISLGIPESIIKMESFSYHKPKESNQTPQGRALNRRFELKVALKDGK